MGQRTPSVLTVFVAFWWALSLCACSPSPAPPAATPQRHALGLAIHADKLQEHMSVLASDEMGGRETGTAGFDRAAAYVVDQLRTLGLRPGAEQWRQPMTIRRSQVDEAQTALTIRVGRRAVEFTYGEHFVTYGIRGETDEIVVTGPLVHAGDGVAIPDRSLDAYRNLDIRKKVVVLTAGAPPSLSEGERSYYGAAMQKATEAAARGAHAILLVDEPQIPWELRVLATRQLGTSETQPLVKGCDNPIPVVYLNQTAAEQILAAPAGTQAALRLRQRSREVRSANVVAILPGSDSRVAHEHVVVMAHCDHVGVGEPVDGDTIYNGAVDNASGVAAMLEIARTLSSTQLARSVIFLCTTGEEQGLVGSRYFVAHQNDLAGPIVAAINIDGTSIQPFTSLDVRGGSNSSLGAAAEEAARQVGIQVRHESLALAGSDHSPFVLAGIPAVWIGAALPDDWMRTRYHTPQDDMRQPIDFAAAATYARFVATLTRLVAATPTPPVWGPGEFFARPR